jgi:hypothetical protein
MGWPKLGRTISILENSPFSSITASFGQQFNTGFPATRRSIPSAPL